MANRREDYRAIAAWGKIMGSYASYVLTEQNIAADQNAPIDAVFYCLSRERWIRIGEIENTNTMRELAILLAQPSGVSS